MVYSLVFSSLGAVFAASAAPAIEGPVPAQVSEASAPEQASTPPAVDYSATFVGAPRDLDETLRAASRVAQARRPLPTRAALRRAAAADVETLTGVLRASGRYAAGVEAEVSEEQDGRARVVFRVTPGPVFRIAEHRLIYVDAPIAGLEDARPTALGDLGINPDDPETNAASGAALQKLQQRALTALWNQGYPAAKIVSRRAVADPSAGTAIAEFAFESGPRATFGALEVSGAVATDEAFLHKLKTWEDGGLFEQAKLQAFRDRLAATGFYSTLDVASGAPGPDGAAPVIVTLEERKPRTFGAGLSYSTAEGPGGRLFFEYRNVLGAGEVARAELQGTAVAQSLRLDINKPLPEFPGSVFAQLGFANQSTDAFTAQTVTLGAGFARRWFDERLETRGGLAFETSRIREGDVSEQTYLASLPLSATWNTETDPLSLDRGERASLLVTPYAGSDVFTRADFAARSRVNFGTDDRFTLAARTRVGATFGASFTDLPLTQRFFAGGGASVRGFGFQKAGPLDVDGDPVGGRSIIEGGVEARMRVIRTVQIAAFADAASVSRSALPDPTGVYFVGVGGGARYFTPIGPMRVDVAIPLDRRETDASFQLFVSLGQPF